MTTHSPSKHGCAQWNWETLEIGRRIFRLTFVSFVHTKHLPMFCALCRKDLREVLMLQSVVCLFDRICSGGGKLFMDFFLVNLMSLFFALGLLEWAQFPQHKQWRLPRQRRSFFLLYCCESLNLSCVLAFPKKQLFFFFFITEMRHCPQVALAVYKMTFVSLRPLRRLNWVDGF